MGLLIDQFRLGGLRVAALSDGIGEQRPGDWFPGVEARQWMAAMGVSEPDAMLPVNFGSFLVRGGGRTVLVDTGNGTRTRGQHEGAAGLPDRLRELGVAPDEVDTVLLTHSHADHVGWNVSDDAGDVTFSRARYFLHQADVDYLTADTTPDSPGVRFSRSRVLPVRDAGQLETLSGEHSPLPGFTMLPTPGHTPGHCSVLLESQGERLILVGDVAPSVAHLEHPEWTPVFDMDGARAVRSRRDLAERAIAGAALLSGGHFPILTVGRLRRVEQGYRWEPVEVERLALEESRT